MELTLKPYQIELFKKAIAARTMAQHDLDILLEHENSLLEMILGDHGVNPELVIPGTALKDGVLKIQLKQPVNGKEIEKT